MTGNAVNAKSEALELHELSYDEAGSADDCVKVLDTKTGRLAPWRYF